MQISVDNLLSLAGYEPGDLAVNQAKIESSKQLSILLIEELQAVIRTLEKVDGYYIEDSRFTGPNQKVIDEAKDLANRATRYLNNRGEL